MRDHGRGLCGTEIATLMDRRVPQPGEYAEYGVPPEIVPGVEALYAQRNICPEHALDALDDAIFRLLWPWIKART